MFYAKIIMSFIAIALISACTKSVETTVSEKTFPSPELLSRVSPKGKYDPQAVSELEELRDRLSDPRKQAVAELLIAGQHSLPGSPMSLTTVRERLATVSRKHAGTWVSAAAKLARAITYGSFDSHQDQIQAWLDALHDPGLAEFSEGNDPLLQSLLAGEAKENSKKIEDIIRYKLVYTYTIGFDLRSAEEMAAAIQSEDWRNRANQHLERLRGLDADELKRRRERFLETQRQF